MACAPARARVPREHLCKSFPISSRDFGNHWEATANLTSSAILCWSIWPTSVAASLRRKIPELTGGNADFDDLPRLVSARVRRLDCRGECLLVRVKPACGPTE